MEKTELANKMRAALTKVKAELKAEGKNEASLRIQDILFETSDETLAKLAVIFKEGMAEIKKEAVVDTKPAGEAVYWLSPLSGCDICSGSFEAVMYDAKTKQGPWGNMCQKCYVKHGVGRLGTGFGQKYEKQADGRWLKTEG
jgi:hypothetical protein